MCSKQAEFTVTKKQVAFLSIVLDGCVFIWVGQNGRFTALNFAQLYRGAALIEMPGTNVFVDGFSVKLNKIFPDKQVFFSTDINSEDPVFWMEMLKCITEFANENKEFYRIGATQSEELRQSAV